MVVVTYNFVLVRYWERQKLSRHFHPQILKQSASWAWHPITVCTEHIIDIFKTITEEKREKKCHTYKERWPCLLLAWFDCYKIVIMSSPQCMKRSLGSVLSHSCRVITRVFVIQSNTTLPSTNGGHGENGGMRLRWWGDDGTQEEGEKRNVLGVNCCFYAHRLNLTLKQASGAIDVWRSTHQLAKTKTMGRTSRVQKVQICSSYLNEPADEWTQFKGT